MLTFPYRRLLSRAFAVVAALSLTPVAAAAEPVQQWQHPWNQGAVFYQVFLRSFADSNGDGIGDIRGLIGKLDLLNDGDPATTTDLGVDALWIMPPYPTPSYHGYDVLDEEAINPLYGTMADFDELIAQAHRRGMRVILDFVMNHTSDRHPWFVSAASSRQSPYRDWYVWSDTPKDWVQPWETGATNSWHEKNGAYYYAAFFAGLPDLNYRNPAVLKKMEEIAGVWLKRGVDGFRLDGARFLVETGKGLQQRDTPETHAVWRDFAAFVRSVRPEATLVGEEWLPPEGTPIIARYYGSDQVIKGGDELSMSFDFPIQGRIYEGVREGKASKLKQVIAEVRAAYPRDAIDALMLETADMDRLATGMKGDTGKLKLAASLLLTLPGAPFIFYGQELGMPNGKPGKEDEQRRTPMPWTPGKNGGFTTGTPWYPLAEGWKRRNVETESKDPKSLLSWYRNLIRARRSNAALREGDLKLLDTASNSVVAYVRKAGQERVLVVHNLARSKASALSLPLDGAGWEPVLLSPGAQLKGTVGAWKAELPAMGSGIWRAKQALGSN